MFVIIFQFTKLTEFFYLITFLVHFFLYFILLSTPHFLHHILSHKTYYFLNVKKCIKKKEKKSQIKHPILKAK